VQLLGLERGGKLHVNPLWAWRFAQHRKDTGETFHKQKRGTKIRGGQPG
jgi:hypothetical protein